MKIVRALSTSLVVLAATLALLFAAACSKPVPPTITPKSAEVKKVTAEGLEVELTIDVDNPNQVALSARSVKARIKLGDGIDLGEVTVPTKVDVGAKKHKEIVAPLSVKWSDLPAIGLLAATRTEIPFTVEGSAQVGIDQAHFDVPFKTGGTLTRDQLIAITGKALPGLTLPSSLPALPF
jgi:LEA14-like dessication related protein